MSFARSWKIRITQHACDSPDTAPEGCLQYITGISGNVSSFNWKLDDNMNDASFSNHLANLRYSVCVRRESGYCSIDWSVGSSNQVSDPLNKVNFIDRLRMMLATSPCPGRSPPAPPGRP